MWSIIQVENESMGRFFSFEFIKLIVSSDLGLCSVDYSNISGAVFCRFVMAVIT